MEQRYKIRDENFVVEKDDWGRPEIWISSEVASPDDLAVLEKFLVEKFDAKFRRKDPGCGAEYWNFKIGREKLYIWADEVEGIGIVARKEKSLPTMERINEALKGKVWKNPDESIYIES